LAFEKGILVFDHNEAPWIFDMAVLGMLERQRGV
jgi:hypothetical protein